MQGSRRFRKRAASARRVCSPDCKVCNPDVDWEREKHSDAKRLLSAREQLCECVRYISQEET